MHGQPRHRLHAVVQDPSVRIQAENRRGRRSRAGRIQVEEAAAARSRWRARARMTEEEVRLYQAVVETDFSYLVFPDSWAPFFPGGAAQLRGMNDDMSDSMKLFKEHAAERLKEYRAKGHLEHYPPPADGKLPPYFLNRLGNQGDSRL